MKTVLMSVVSFLAISAFAHVEPGVYRGQTASGEVCEITAGLNYFLDNKAHPLNERIEMVYGGEKYIVQHPPVIDELSSTAFFNHDAFHGILATNTGAKALIVHMLHTDSYEGPGSFTAIDHQWKSGNKVTVACLNIKKQ